MDELISVIVPVYNGADTLERCMQSIAEQSYSSLEVICIDDGSSDSSGEIAERWTRCDHRFKVIHQENKGLSAARNAGIKAAAGKYLAFVDCDDFIDSKMLGNMLGRMLEDNSDLCICNVLRVNELGEPIEGMNDEVYIKDGCFSCEEILNNLLYYGMDYYGVAWNKLYKRELFSNILFPVGKIHEDVYVAHRIIGACDRISCLSARLYHYTVRQGSIMNSAATPASFDAVDSFLDRALFFFQRGNQGGGAWCLRHACWLNVCTLKRIDGFKKEAQKRFL